MGPGHKEKLRMTSRSHQLQKQIKDLFTQKIPSSIHLLPSFFLAYSSHLGFTRASLLALVHFVSGFNTRGLTYCCGNHCLCFLQPAALLLSHAIIDQSLTIQGVYFFPLRTNEQRTGLLMVFVWRNRMFFLGRVLETDLSCHCFAISTLSCNISQRAWSNEGASILVQARLIKWGLFFRLQTLSSLPCAASLKILIILFRKCRLFHIYGN